MNKVNGPRQASGKPCSQARKAETFAAVLAYCRRCLKGVPDDYHAFICIGKLAYLHGEYQCATQYYLRAAGLSLFRHLDPSGLKRLRQRSCKAPERAQRDAVATIKEHEPTLLYHLGHAYHGAAKVGSDEYRTHLIHYTKSVRGLTPTAYDPSPNLLAHFHDQGLTALQRGGEFIFTVIEQYGRLYE